MKKISILLFTALFAFNLSNAQKKQEKLEAYTASNGITYKVDDEIKLGRGSDTNGKFVYVNIGGWAVSTNPEQNRLGAGNAGLIVTVKKIIKYNYKRYKGVYFTVGGGNITNYILDIENAISTCEVENCVDQNTAVQASSDKYDKLSKIKGLLDEGVLTQEEYDAEKKIILENNK
ncbi:MULTISPECIES: SHOCT domain-containing protein [Bizionia]|uniref:SHOCT domain-containing protein n=1 Tax=Bizionia algoritergicola TaxID=291187 RepID=A0A5D0QX20_9FLAO|nr:MULTISPECIES: SHOCT domain-containing protein [Bizionia]OBX22197.1 hypothetical protein BAA08_09645 [Bizionia sp. APA-3]TYB73231.1 SHOCT domain-containing protein [Bizionia algoritergicola]